MTDITLPCKWRGSSGNRPPHLEIKDKEAKVRTNKWNKLVGVLAISLFLEINGRGRNSDLYAHPETGGPSIKPCFRDLWSLYTHMGED
jgi:hypothetical protein